MRAVDDGQDWGSGEFLADVRDAFAHIETAISTADPQQCRSFVSEELYQNIAGTVRDLSARGHRRIHGSFEIIDAARIDGTSDDDIRVRLRAASSIMELDRQGRLVAGSPELMSWSQDVTVAPREAPAERPRWIIRDLGPLSIEGVVSGPAGPPMDPVKLASLRAQYRARDQELDHHIALFRANVVNIVNIGAF